MTSDPAHAVDTRPLPRGPHSLAREQVLASQRGRMLAAIASSVADKGYTATTVGDLAHAYMYAQRTADWRIALGGRGVPYRFGSRTDADGATQPGTVRSLAALLRTMFPAAGGARIEHAWAGVLGVPRDWRASVGLDARSGMGWAGGYVGTGVAASNLAGRTLRDLVLGADSELAAMPWVNRKVRRWEPEPLRWLGVHAMYRAYHAADRAERDGRADTSPIARAADLVSGR